MEVRCENCDKVYLLDDAFISPSGTPVKCSACKHVFVVFPWTEDADGRAGWQIRGADGETRPIRRISDIRELIMSGKVSPDDEVSTSLGTDWKRVGDIDEMKPFFSAAHPTKVERPSANPPGAGKSRSIAPKIESKKQSPEFREEKKQPDYKPDLGVMDDEPFEPLKPRAKVRVGFWLACIVAAAIGGAGIQLTYLANKPRATATPKARPAPKPDRHLEFLEKGKTYFLADTEDSFTQADRKYYQALALAEHDPETMAALAQLNSAWAQNFRYAEIDERTDSLNATPTKEADKLHDKADEKIQEASKWMKEALRLNPKLASAHLAEADYKRMVGDLDGALESLKMSRGEVEGPEMNYVEAMFLIDKGGYTANEILDILHDDDTAESQPRIMYTKARVLAANNRKKDALEVLNELLKIHPEHERAKALIERIEKGKVVSLRLDNSQTLEEAPEDSQEELATPEPQQEKTNPQPAAQADGLRDLQDMLSQAQKLYSTGKASQAARVFNRVLYRAPSNIDALTGLGNCYLALGFKGKAVAYFANALVVNKSFSPAVIGLAKAYKAQGNAKRAIKYFKRYLTLQPSGQWADLASKSIEELENKP